MDYEKYFLKSKTILAALLVAAVALAPTLGISFGQDDAAMITETADKIITALGAVLVVYFRMTATTQLTTKVDTTITKSPWMVSVAVGLMLALSACVSPTSLDGKTPLEKLTLSFDAAKTNVEIYKLLPPCADGVIGLCSKASVSAKLDEYIAKVQGYIDIANAATAGGDTDAAIGDAQNALRTLLTIYAVQALTKA